MSAAWKKTLIITAVSILLLAALAAAAISLLMNNPDRVAAVVSDALGREVVIGEITDLQLGSESSILVRDISIANPAWAGQARLLELQRVRVHLDLPSLWRDGPIVINDLEISGLQANLLAPGDQSPSWEMGTEPTTPSSRPDEGPVRLPVVIRQAHFTDSSLLYSDPDREVTALIEGQLEGGEGIHLQLQGQSRNRPVSFTGRVARVGAGLEIAGEGMVERWQVTLDGGLADPFAFRGLDMRLEITGSLPLAEVTEEEPKAMPLELQLQLEGSGRRMNLQRGLILSGDSRIELKGTLGNPGTLQGMKLALAASSPDLRQLLLLPPAEAAAPLQFKAELRSDGSSIELDGLRGRFSGARLRGDAELPLGSELDGASVRFNAAGESLVQVLAPWVDSIQADYHFDVDLIAHWEPPRLRLEKVVAEVGENRLNGNLTLLSDESGAALQGKVRLSGKRAHGLLEIFGINSNLPDDSYFLRGELETTAAGGVTLTGLDAQLGRSDLAGDIRYQPGAPGRLAAEIHSTLLDIRFLSDQPEPAQKQPGNGKEKNNLRSQEPLTQKQLGDRVIPDTPIDLEWMQGVEGEITLGIDRLVVRDKLDSSVEIKLALADGALTSEKMQWQGDYSSGSASLAVRALPRGGSFNLSIESERLPLIWLLTGNPDPLQTSTYNIALEGAGATPRELAGSINGAIIANGSGGRVDNQGMGLLLGDVFGEIFSQIDPSADQEPYTNVVCHAAGLSITDGLVDITPGAVLRTDDLDIVLGGQVNLGNEQLNVVFNTRSRTGVGISASKVVTPYVKLGGNFANPRVGVNTKGVVVSGGAAVATGGLSIVAEGMWDRWVATSVNPCEALFDKADSAGSELKKVFGRP